MAGLAVGHFTETRRPTGCTVVLMPEGAVGGVDVRGAARARARPNCCRPLNAVEKVHAVMLAGGSAFGLDAAGGVMRWLEERGRRHRRSARPAFPSCPRRSCSTCGWAMRRIRPDAAAGHAACAAASRDTPAQGNVGAGAGASVGKLFGIERAMKGGIGSASVTVGGVTVGAIVAVNALGDTSTRPAATARSPARALADGRLAAGHDGRVPAARRTACAPSSPAAPPRWA